MPDPTRIRDNPILTNLALLRATTVVRTQESRAVKGGFYSHG